MIRINLLGAAKPKKGKKPVIEATGGVSTLFAGTLIMLALAGAGNGYYWWKVQRDSQKIEAELHRAEVENRRLSDVKASYLEREKVKDNYKRRVDVIDELRKGQLGPVSLLNMIGTTVNSTDEVWLSMMTDDGPNIELKGTALSVHGVADLMRNLQNTGYFKTVEIKETFQDTNSKEMQTFVFSMTCEKATQAPPDAAQPVKGSKKS
jgi:Tfp pilus assembly protein PilN